MAPTLKHHARVLANAAAHAESASEVAARLVCATRLAEWIRDKSGLTFATADERDALANMPGEWWAEASKQAGNRKPPSTKTRAVTLDLLTPVDDAGDADPFEGL